MPAASKASELTPTAISPDVPPLARPLVNEATRQAILQYLRNPDERNFSLHPDVRKSFDVLLLSLVTLPAQSLLYAQINSVPDQKMYPQLLEDLCAFANSIEALLKSNESASYFNHYPSLASFESFLSDIFSFNAFNFCDQRLDHDVTQALRFASQSFQTQNEKFAYQQIKLFMQQIVSKRMTDNLRSDKTQIWSSAAVDALNPILRADPSDFIQLFRAYMMMTVGSVQKHLYARREDVEKRDRYLKEQQFFWERDWKAFELLLLERQDDIPEDEALIPFLAELIEINIKSDDALIMSLRSKITWRLSEQKQVFLRHLCWRLASTNPDYRHFCQQNEDLMHHFADVVLAAAAISVAANKYVPAQCASAVGEPTEVKENDILQAAPRRVSVEYNQ